MDYRFLQVLIQCQNIQQPQHRIGLLLHGGNAIQPPIGLQLILGQLQIGGSLHLAGLQLIRGQLQIGGSLHLAGSQFQTGSENSK